MADTHQRWICSNDSWEEDARSSPLVAVPWNLLADHSRKSHGRPSLLSSDAQGLCFFRRGDLSSDHGHMFLMQLSYSSLCLHISPSLSTVESSLEESPAWLLSLFYLDRYFLAWSLLPLTWILSPCLWLDVSPPFPPCMYLILGFMKILCSSCHSPIHELSIPPLFIR